MYSFVVTNICTNMNERERVLAIKGGDHQAFIDLYNEYWSQVYDFSRLYIATIADAEEIVQDVFVKLWESRHLLKEDENIKGFLFIVTRNIVFNKNKKRVNEDYCASQLKIFIDRLINSLPEQQRKCFLLSREESLSYKEIAERLGISQKTVEIHMGKALKFLKDKVKRGWEILLSLLSF